MSRTAELVSILDAEIMAVRSRYAARLAQEHVRMAKERQSVLDRAIVAQREARILAGRGKAIVRSLVDP